jgi:hypothetical protein
MAEREPVASFGEIRGQHRDSTACAFAALPAHLTQATMRIPHGYWGSGPAWLRTSLQIALFLRPGRHRGRREAATGSPGDQLERSVHPAGYVARCGTAAGGRLVGLRPTAMETVRHICLPGERWLLARRDRRSDRGHPPERAPPQATQGQDLEGLDGPPSLAERFDRPPTGSRAGFLDAGSRSSPAPPPNFVPGRPSSSTH